MEQYRKKTVTVEATQFFYDGARIPGVFYPSVSEDGRTYIGDAFIITPEGNRAYLLNGDWVIVAEDGEHHYQCEPDVFAATYEVVDKQHESLWSDDYIRNEYESDLAVLRAENDRLFDRAAKRLAVIYELRAQAQPPQQANANGLLPCPFCGADTMVLEGPGGAMVVCGGNRCAVMPSSKDKDLAAAITAWNRRAQPPAPQPVLDAMDRCLNRLVAMFDDDANNMPDQLLDDYLASRNWIDAQPIGWRAQPPAAPQPPAPSVPLTDEVREAIEELITIAQDWNRQLDIMDPDVAGLYVRTVEAWLAAQPAPPQA